MAIDMDRAKKFADAIAEMQKCLEDFHKLYNETFTDRDNLELVKYISSEQDLNFMAENVMKKIFFVSNLIATISPGEKQLKEVIESFLVLKDFIRLYMLLHGEVPDLQKTLTELRKKGYVPEESANEVKSEISSGSTPDLNELLKRMSSPKITN